MPQKNYTLLGVAFNAGTQEDLLRQIEALCAAKGGGYVSFTNVSVINAATQDPKAAKALNAADINCVDGMPIAWLARRDGLADVERTAGPDLMRQLLARGIEAGKRHFFYGATDETLARLRERLTAELPGLCVAGTLAPPFRPLTPEEDAQAVRAIRDAAADYVWVGLGAPKQDLWMQAHRQAIAPTVALGVGAAFDFFAGTVRRAPVWMQKSGLEWLWRLSREPGRLGKRYLHGNLYFVRSVLRARRAAKRSGGE